MRFLAVSLRKDWARVRRDPSQFAVPLGIPIVLTVLMTLVFGRGQAAPHGTLLVADEDNSAASNLFLSPFHRDPMNAMFTVEKVTRADGRARIDRGEASAFLVIPAGLQANLTANQPLRLELYTNPSQGILPQIAEETVSATVDASFYLRRAAASAPPGALPFAMAGLLRQFASPAITVATEAARPQPPPRNFASVFLPSMLFMGMLFLGSNAASDIWKERTGGTLRRIALSPVPMSSYLAARVAFVAMLYVVVAFAGLAAAQRFAGLEIPNLPAAALWLTFSGTAFYMGFLLIAVQPETQRAAAVLANLIIFPLAMLGGCFFPFEWMPTWMQTAGKFTPNGWALTQFNALLAGAADPRHLLVAAALLAGLSAVAFLFTLRRLRGGFAV